MKCQNPECDRGFSFVAQRRDWFGKRQHRAKQCRDTFVAEGVRQSRRVLRLTPVGCSRGRLRSPSRNLPSFASWLAQSMTTVSRPRPYR
jgi:hypothetical protein